MPRAIVAFFCVLLCTPASAQPPSRADALKVERNVSYAANDNPRQQLDIYLPAKRMSEEPLPVVVFVHGGAWLAGNKAAGQGRVAPLVRSGRYAGVSIGYRFSREAKWPAQIHDCKAAIRWIRANAERLNLNPDRIGVWGSSAGGHLVAMLGTSGRVKQLEGNVGKHLEQPSTVQCVVDFFGPTDFLQMNSKAAPDATLDHDAPNSPESLLIGGPIQENPNQVAKANPITYVTRDDPPLLIAHGVNDKLVAFHQSELLHAAYQAAGANSVLLKVKNAGHGWRSREIDRLVERFFAHHLRNEPTVWRDQELETRSVR